MSAVQDFLKNNRGIDDGADLPEAYLSDLYDRIINDGIKMKVRPFRRLLGQNSSSKFRTGPCCRVGDYAVFSEPSELRVRIL